MRRSTLVVGLILMTCPAPVPALDLTDWNDLLARYVDGRGMVDYGAWKRESLPRLDRFLSFLARESPDGYGSREDRLAFWINAYNACVIRGVLRRYPMQSVMDDPGFFKEQVWEIAGVRMSLDQIENQKIRPVFSDFRIHFALVCGARSCPRLLPRAYTGAGLDALLDAQGREFLADASRNRFDSASRTAHLSQIFQWFPDDFTRAGGSLASALEPFAPPAARALLRDPRLRVDYLRYDWSLNERRSAGSGGGGRAGS